MPKIRTNRTKPPPEGFEEIESILDDYTRKMRDGASCCPTHPRRDSCTDAPARLLPSRVRVEIGRAHV